MGSWLYLLSNGLFGTTILLLEYVVIGNKGKHYMISMGKRLISSDPTCPIIQCLFAFWQKCWSQIV